MKIKQFNRWSQLNLKRKTLQNRIVIPPMASATADIEGFATQKSFDHYQNLSEAMPGLLIVEYTFVHASGRSEENQLGIQSDFHLLGLSQIAQLIKKSNSLAGIQLTHGGGKSERILTGGTLLSPSGIIVPVKDRVLETPDVMVKQDIELWKSTFLKAADRAVLAGFDLIELHSAHGYGLNQWLSPLTNHRTDEYGNDNLGRMKLLLEIVQLIRHRHPQLLISVRMPGQDFIEGGLTIADCMIVAKALELADVDILHVSSGMGGWRRSSDRTGEGYLVNEAHLIASAVSIPVIGVGGIHTGKYIDEGISKGFFSLAAVGRAILQGPKKWHESVMTNEENLTNIAY
jgi:NADPH2 dehydrogenase